MAKKKKQTLDNLLNTGRISQPTYEQFNEEINNTIAEIEKQQNALLEKMNSTTEQLEGQIRTLEILLANFEIQHVTGEIEEESYQREISLLSAGLETARKELDVVKEAVSQLVSSIQTPEIETVAKQKIESEPQENVDVPNTEVEVAEQPVPAAEEQLQEPSPPVENVETNESDSFQNQPEEFKSADESQPTETDEEDEEKQEE